VSQQVVVSTTPPRPLKQVVVDLTPLMSTATVLATPNATVSVDVGRHSALIVLGLKFAVGMHDVAVI
jgi:hypothetical protein